MSYLTLLLCLVLLNSIEKSGHVIGHLISCGDPTWQSADVVEDTGVMMLVSHSLMPNDVELIPSLDYEGKLKQQNRIIDSIYQQIHILTTTGINEMAHFIGINV